MENFGKGLASPCPWVLWKKHHSLENFGKGFQTRLCVSPKHAQTQQSFGKGFALEFVLFHLQHVQPLEKVCFSWCLVQIYQTFGKGFEIGALYRYFFMYGGWRENKTSKSYNPILIYFNLFVFFFIFSSPQKKEKRSLLNEMSWKK